MDVDDSETVRSVKEKIETLKGVECLADRQKLICAGKLLEDAATISNYDVESNIIVILVTKPVTTQPPEDDTASLDEDLSDLREKFHSLGYSYSLIDEALAHSQNDVNAAVDYLTCGMFMDYDEEDEFARFYEEEEANPLDFLYQLPQFAGLKRIIQRNPGHLSSVLNFIKEKSPDLYDTIMNHKEDLIRILNEPCPLTQPPTQPLTQIPISSRDVQAIDRLMDLGFPERLVYQAYFACDRDEGLTAHFLHSQVEEDDNLPH